MTRWEIAYLDETGDVVLVEILGWVVEDVVDAVEVDVLAAHLERIRNGPLRSKGLAGVHEKRTHIVAVISTHGTQLPIPWIRVYRSHPLVKLKREIAKGEKQLDVMERGQHYILQFRRQIVEGADCNFLFCSHLRHYPHTVTNTATVLSPSVFFGFP